MIAIALPMTLLLACGGGGGSGTAVAPTTNPPTMMPPTTGDPNTPPVTTPDPNMPPTVTLPGYAITNLPAARTAVSGTAPASMAETQIVTAIQTRATAADTFEFRGFSGTPSASVTCSNSSTCSGNVPDVGILTFSLTDIEDLSLVDDDMNLVDFDSDTEAVMVDEGVTMIQSQAAAGQNDGTHLTFQTYGGWLTNSVFGVELLSVTESGRNTNRFASLNFGDDSGSRPSVTANWNGAMVALTQQGEILQGRSIFEYDGTGSRFLVIRFNNTFNLNTGSSFSYSDGDSEIEWTLVPVKTDGSFTTADGTLSGSFYGATHGEIAGTFNRENLIGAFGATR